ncbi:MAG: RNA polymerase sigma factor [bacterium]
MIEEWVEQCRNGQTRAYAQVVQAMQNRILAFLFRMTGNRETAEDLGQEVFLRAYRQLHRYDRKKAAFSTWLFTLARNLCLDAMRKKQAVCVPWDESGGVDICPDPNPSARLYEQELERRVAASVGSLDPEYREVFILREYEQLPLEEISQVTGCPVGTVKSRLHRARLLLQEKLTPILNL